MIKLAQEYFLTTMILLMVGQLFCQPLDWENPAMFDQNKEPAHATLMPFKDEHSAITKKRQESVYYKSLNGNWKFKWVRKPADRPVDFYKNSYDVSSWDNITVPSNSFSSPAKGRKAFAEYNFEQEHVWNQLDYKGGDINTSIIKTALGRTIMVQWDETSPRPYSRHNLIQGTKGTLAGFPTRVALEGGVEGGTENHHVWAEGEQLQALFEKYEHPLYKRLGELARKMGGHGGMDFIMRYRILECLRNGLPLDQNLYEGCFWSAVGPLSEASVNQDGAPQKFPDFTRGDWKNTKPLSIIL